MAVGAVVATAAVVAFGVSVAAPPQATTAISSRSTEVKNIILGSKRIIATPLYTF